MPGYNLPKNMNENIGHFIIRQEAANNCYDQHLCHEL